MALWESTERMGCMPYPGLLRLPILFLIAAVGTSASTSWLEPVQAVAGEEVTLYYDPAGGPLAGAAAVFVHRGINGWSAVAAPDLAMEKNPQDGYYSLTYRLPEAALSVEYAFNNGSGTWDNNNSADWRFPVVPMEAPVELPEPPPLPARASQARVRWPPDKCARDIE